jgi:hypothetical protein
VTSDPGGDGAPSPDSTNGQLGLGSWEIRMRPDDLMYTLTRYAEHLGHLRNAHQILGHQRNSKKMV